MQVPEEEKKVEGNPSLKGKLAVKGISFGVKPGECFGLLGVNGAGKSSTFKCLAADEHLSGGEIKVNGIEIGEYFGKPWKMHGVLGYCPQFDPIDRHLTVLQTLTLFGNLAGIQQNVLHSYVMSIIFKIGLHMFIDTKAGNLSGGNKRKLCLATALIGRPHILLIDEASAGVDPASRRNMWKTIKDEGQDSAVVITTHAMEEAEQLSSKLGIMVNGQFKCYGSLPEIQREFGLGYEIELSLNLP